MSKSGELANIAPPYLLPLTKRVKVKGIEFDEEFVAELISKYFSNRDPLNEPRLSDALQIYIAESTSGDGRKFRGDALNSFRKFVNLIGDLHLSELRHIHICQFRDYLFETGLTPVTVRKQTAILSAMLNIAFRHLDIDRLSPFRGLKIPGENEHKRPMRTVTHELLVEIKQRLLHRIKPYKLIGLIQLNTGMRLSEPVFARLEDLVLDHPIPHLWIRRNELSSRKNKSSIRAVPLVGTSLYAAQRLFDFAQGEGSEWLVPEYAHYHGSNSCSAILNKHLKDLDFRSHMFRHALIDRMKACNDIPTRLAESITGHCSGGSEFNNYGTVGYTLEQKLEVLKRIEI
jgi:integrase